MRDSKKLLSCALRRERSSSSAIGLGGERDRWAQTSDARSNVAFVIGWVQLSIGQSKAFR